jgi:hypothetical protein
MAEVVMSIKSLKISLFLLAIGIISIASVIAFTRRPSVNPVVESQVNEKAPKPLFVLIEYNPWAMVIGADTPTLALYDDGTVIYWRKEGRGGKYVSAKLADSEVSQVLEKVNPQTFTSLESRYEPAGGISDAPETVMVLRKKDGTHKGVYVYGSIRRADDGSYPRGVPNLVADIFHFATTYDNPKATEWLPDYIEVIVWPYEYAPDKDLVWPKGWPDLSDPRTVKNGDGYSIYLEKARFEELKAFLAKRRERQAVRISGKKWAIDARLPFPNEQIWREMKSRLGSDSH